MCLSRNSDSLNFTGLKNDILEIKMLKEKIAQHHLHKSATFLKTAGYQQYVIQRFLWKVIVHGIGDKLVSNWEQNMLYPKRKRTSMLTGSKVSSLASKCVFYRPEHNAKGGPHGTEF